MAEVTSSPAELGKSLGSGSDISIMDLQPLSAEDMRNVRGVVDAYDHFWAQNLRREGWASASFSRSDVEDLLKNAAEYVVRIRKHLDGKPAGAKHPTRVIGGSSQDYLWTVDWNPADDPRRFVRGLVHATFKDTRGYVEGLSEALVDDYVEEIDEYYSGLPHHHRRSRLRPKETFPPDWAGTAKDYAARVAANLEHVISSTTATSPVEENRWVSIIQALEQANQHLVEVLKERHLSAHGDEEGTLHKAASVSRLSASMKRKSFRQMPTSPSHGEAQEPPPVQDDTAAITIRHVGENVTHLKQNVEGLLQDCTGLDPERLQNDPSATEAVLSGLQQRVFQSSELLMQDLLTLDQIVTATPEQRQKKKQEITAIQDLLTTVDSLEEKLRNLRDSFQQRQKEEASARKAQEEAARKAKEEARLKQRRQLLDNIELLDKVKLGPAAWRQVKCTPKFEVIEQPESYVCQAYVPGMDKSTIAVDLSADMKEITISGTRIPTDGEINALIAQAARSVESGQFNEESLAPLTGERLLLTLAAGRFGAFEQRYQLPPDVRTDGISANYNNGVLYIQLPRIVSGGRPSLGGAFPRAPDLFHDPNPAQTLLERARAFHQQALSGTRTRFPDFDDLFWQQPSAQSGTRTPR